MAIRHIAINLSKSGNYDVRIWFKYYSTIDQMKLVAGWWPTSIWCQWMDYHIFHRQNNEQLYFDIKYFMDVLRGSQAIWTKSPSQITMTLRRLSILLTASPSSTTKVFYGIAVGKIRWLIHLGDGEKQWLSCSRQLDKLRLLCIICNI